MKKQIRHGHSSQDLPNDLRRSPIRQLLGLLTAGERRRGLALLAMIVLMALFEVTGVASVMPFLAVLANPEVMETNQYFAALRAWLDVSDVDTLLSVLGGFVFVALVVSISFRALTTYVLLRYTHMCGYSLACRLVAGYLHQPYEWFLNRHSADLAKTVLAEVQQVIGGSLIPAIRVTANCMVVTMLLGLLIVVDPVIAIGVGLGLGGIYGLIYLALRGRLERIGADRVKATRERYKVLGEGFGGIKDVKVSGLERNVLNRFVDPALRNARHSAAAQAAEQLPRFALEILAFGGMLLVVLYLLSGDGGLERALPLIGVYAFAGYRLMPALQSVYADISKMRFAGPALESLHRDFAALDAAPTTAAGIQAPLSLSESIRLDKISYSYPEADRTSLEGIDMEIPARSSVGLVGATGSGKTTAVDIILGLLRPASGQLLVDGTAITEENVRAWQRSLGYVPQSIFLMDDTVAANIAFGIDRDLIDMGAVYRAAQTANLHEFVVDELANGYATLVGERGVRLSGGQRQRIGIARALYHDPKVLVLDEATSALDNLTEQAVMEAMDNLGHGMTVIVIAHRLSTVRNCNQIYLLEKGYVKATGSYEELVAGDAQFRRLAKANANF